VLSAKSTNVHKSVTPVHTVVNKNTIKLLLNGVADWINCRLSGKLFRRGTNKKNAKLGQMAWEVSRNLLLEFWEPLHISGMGEAKNFKFGTLTVCKMPYTHDDQ